MEEILSSIKRIIAEEGEGGGKSSSRGTGRDKAKPKAPDNAALATATIAEPDSHDSADEILELTDAVEPEYDGREIRCSAATADKEGGAMADNEILSDEAAVASRHSLAALSALLIRPDDAPSNTLEGLVRDMLRPMLREWLDANLPELVEKVVAKEIARLTQADR